MNQKSFGFNHSHGPELFDELVSRMAEDVLEISSASARRLYNAFAVGMTKAESKDFKPITSLTSVPICNEKAEENELVVSRVSIDPQSGICPRSRVKLKLIKLDKQQRTHFIESIFRLSKTRFEEFNKSREMYVNKDNATKAVKDFAKWLDTREGDPFTAIVGMLDCQLTHLGHRFISPFSMMCNRWSECRIFHAKF